MIKILFAILISFILISCSTRLNSIDVKKGWKVVQLGERQDQIEKELGEGENINSYGEVYFMDYISAGIEISYNTANSRVRAIYFYNKDNNYEHFATFKGKTEEGIGWSATRKDIIDTYGEPIKEFHGDNWRRIEFEGFDFRFRNGVLSRIGLFEKK